MAGIDKLSFGLTALMYFMASTLTAALTENAPSAPVASPEVYKVIAENMDFRIIKATLQPGQEDKSHSHPADQVSLYQTDCKLRLTNLDGTSIVISQKPGEAAVRMGKPIVSHKVKNIGENVCAIWIVESGN
jgi:quercetin dioxygenase-like cupin family protein